MSEEIDDFIKELILHNTGIGDGNLPMIKILNHRGMIYLLFFFMNTEGYYKQASFFPKIYDEESQEEFENRKKELKEYIGEWVDELLNIIK